MPHVIVSCTFNPPEVVVQGARLRQDTMDALQRVLPTLTATAAPQQLRPPAPRFLLLSNRADGAAADGINNNNNNNTTDGVAQPATKSRALVPASLSAGGGGGGGTASDVCVNTTIALLDRYAAVPPSLQPQHQTASRAITLSGAAGGGSGGSNDAGGNPDGGATLSSSAGGGGGGALPPTADLYLEYKKYQIDMPSHYSDEKRKALTFLRVMDTLEEEGYALRGVHTIVSDNGKDTTRLIFSRK